MSIDMKRPVAAQLREQGVDMQELIKQGQLAGLSIGQIIMIIFQYGVPVLLQILSLLGSNPTLSVIEAILAAISGLVPAPTPVPPTPAKG